MLTKNTPANDVKMEPKIKWISTALDGRGSVSNTTVGIPVLMMLKYRNGCFSSTEPLDCCHLHLMIKSLGNLARLMTKKSHLRTVS